MSKATLTIIISSPDSYSDVFGVFYQCLMRFWQDCSYEVILSTNSYKEYPNIKIIANKAKNDSWINRVIPLLKQVSTKYVLVIADDCFITAPVNSSAIGMIVDDMEKFDLNFCGLGNFKKGIKLNKGSLLNRVNKRQAYAKNLQVGIYNREFLLDCLSGEEVSAWEIEKRWIDETLSACNEYFDDIVSCRENVLHCVHGVVKSKWLPSAIHRLNKIGIEVELRRKVYLPHEELVMLLKKKIGNLFGPRSRKNIKSFLRKFGCEFDTNC